MARSISAEIVLETAESPQQNVPAALGRRIHQSRYFDTIEEKEMIIRVIVETLGDDLIVISAYKTSRVRRYWLEEPQA